MRNKAELRVEGKKCDVKGVEYAGNLLKGGTSIDPNIPWLRKEGILKVGLGGRTVQINQRI